jgi:hypothetical protein
MTEDIQQRAKVGVFGIGLEDYWDQFVGLRDRLEGYQQSVEERIRRWATVVSPGLVDTAPKAYAAGERFAEERVDLTSATPPPTRRARRYSPLSRKWESPLSSSTSSQAPRSTTRTQTRASGRRSNDESTYAERFLTMFDAAECISMPL